MRSQCCSMDRVISLWTRLKQAAHQGRQDHRSGRAEIDRAGHHRCRPARPAAPPPSRATINRDTVYTFKAGRPVFMLEEADGSRYAMKAYAQIVDKALSYDNLPALGAELKLPSGRRYSSTVPEKDLV